MATPASDVWSVASAYVTLPVALAVLISTLYVYVGVKVGRRVFRTLVTAVFMMAVCAFLAGTYLYTLALVHMHKASIEAAGEATAQFAYAIYRAGQNSGFSELIRRLLKSFA